jgi:formate dehydrogenase subunit beta
MEELRKKARELLENGTAQVVIGYARGSTAEKVRAVFVCSPQQTQELIFNEHCTQNLAVYLLKHEVKALGKPALVARLPALRTVLQLAAEGQIAEGQVVVLAVVDDGKVTELADLPSIEKYVAGFSLALSAQQEELVAKIEKMSREERWTFWQEQFARCLKCYACRAACPMCYCTRCVVDANQPQWVPVAPHAVGNLEWHLVRAMHLAGRCVSCGCCVEACPVGIPLNLLTLMLAREVSAEFGLTAGASTKKEYALSVYKPDDKEGFIR